MQRSRHNLCKLRHNAMTLSVDLRTLISRIEPVTPVINLSEAEGSYIYTVIKRDGLSAYEPETIATLVTLLERSGENKCFVDIGANIGLYSLIVKALFGENVSVTAFEPAPALFETVTKLMAANSLKLDVGSCALGAEKGTAKFYISKSDCSNSLKEGFREAKEVVDVTISTLDTELQHIYRPGTIVKLDTETTEGDVLSGGMEWVKKNRPWIVCEVLYNLEDPRIPNLLKPLGYHFYHLSKQGPVKSDTIVGEKTFKQRDWLLAPELLTEEIEDRIISLTTRISRITA